MDMVVEVTSVFSYAWTWFRTSVLLFMVFLLRLGSRVCYLNSQGLTGDGLTDMSMESVTPQNLDLGLLQYAYVHYVFTCISDLVICHLCYMRIW